MDTAMSAKLTLRTKVLLDPKSRATAFGRYHDRLRRKPAIAQPDAFDVPTQLIGKTPDGKVSVYYDPAVGPEGLALGQQVLTTGSSTYATAQAFFNISGGPIGVILAALSNATDGSGGAYHNDCSFNTGGTIYCDVAFGNPILTNGLIVAELTECFMGLQSMGWNCGSSNGEALSRFLAQQTSGGPDGALAEYATAPQWEAAGRPNWIDATEPTDQDGISIGCGMVYLYWMLSKGLTPPLITQAGCPDGTLASNYAGLTGRTSAWADFSAALAGLAGSILSDDPWTESTAVANGATAPSTGQLVIDPASQSVTLPPNSRVL
jgi:hypothetical protein